SQSRDVSARPGKAGGEPLTNRIAHDCDDDWNTTGSLLRRSDCGIAGSHDDVDARRDQLRRQHGQSFDALGIANIEGDVLAIQVAELTQSLTEGCKSRSRLSRRLQRQQANARKPYRLLRERRKRMSLPSRRGRLVRCLPAGTTSAAARRQ